MPSRLIPGAMGGLAGALAFGILMLTSFILTTPDLAGRGLLPVLTRLTGSDNILLAWALHLLIGVVFGAAFAGMGPRGPMLLQALQGGAYGVLLWTVAGQLVGRALLEQAPVWDAMAAYSLVGHLVYGFVLGLVYAPMARSLHQARAAREPPKASRTHSR